MRDLSDQPSLGLQILEWLCEFLRELHFVFAVFFENEAAEECCDLFGGELIEGAVKEELSEKEFIACADLASDSECKVLVLSRY